MSDTTLDKLHARFDAEAARDMEEVFQFHFSDAGDHYLVVKDGTLEVCEGEHEDPSVSLSLSTTTLRGVMKGEISGMSAFMSGRLKATGNVMLATRLGSLFPAD
ncbi:SCP2 sterol-binding domain-containing protein [Halomonas sp. M4R1S46]|uniref:SCP2 sterol-binding domain-containing protein n=1 Tax=Halomonas sp. M4R1S46 TaxID=2982692 RepID=UPI0021E503A0|nr:SCP2 sterol-binding domain-containing protein [Halomonas sp. M4R1S46]UYG09603.1 SCP2 sterol-binding domain-containing protein [Halomonas sp. M4R1S46]